MTAPTQTTTSPAAPVKSGWRTSELWVTVLSLAGILLPTIQGTLTKEGAAGALAAAILGAVYNYGRAKVKASATLTTTTTIGPFTTGPVTRTL